MLLHDNVPGLIKISFLPHLYFKGDLVMSFYWVNIILAISVQNLKENVSLVGSLGGSFTKGS